MFFVGHRWSRVVRLQPFTSRRHFVSAHPRRKPQTAKTTPNQPSYDSSLFVRSPPPVVNIAAPNVTKPLHSNGNVVGQQPTLYKAPAASNIVEKGNGVDLTSTRKAKPAKVPQRVKNKAKESITPLFSGKSPSNSSVSRSRESTSRPHAAPSMANGRPAQQRSPSSLPPPPPLPPSHPLSHRSASVFPSKLNPSRDKNNIDMFAHSSTTTNADVVSSNQSPDASLEASSPLEYFARLATRQAFKNPSSADDFTSVLAVLALRRVAPAQIPEKLSYVKAEHTFAKMQLSRTLDNLPFVVGSFKPSHLAVCVRSMGILKTIHEKALSSIVGRAKSIVHQFRVHTHIASLMWGLTRLRRDAFELFTRLCEQSIAFLQTFSLESFAIMMHSLGSSDRAWRPSSPLVLSALQAEAANRVPHFSDGMFHMFLKGCAGIRMQFNPALQKIVLKSLQDRQDAMPPHSYPELLGFLARTGVPVRSYLPTYERGILGRLETLRASQMPAILQSFALAHVRPSREFLSRFDARCAEIMHAWPLANLELLVLSMRELDIRASDALLREMQHLTVERIDEFGPSTLCCVLAAHIGSKGLSSKFVRAMKGRLRETQNDFKMHQAPTVFEACASTNSFLGIMLELRHRLLLAVDDYSDALRDSRGGAAADGATSDATRRDIPQVSFSARDFTVISFALAMQSPLQEKSKELVQKMQMFLQDEKLSRGGYRSLRTDALWDYAWSLFAFQLPMPDALLREMFSRPSDTFKAMNFEQTTRACEVLTFLEYNLKPASSSVNGTNTHQSASMVPHALAESIRSKHWNLAPDVAFSAFTDDVRRSIVKYLNVRPVDYTCVKSGKTFLTFPSSRVALDCPDMSQRIAFVMEGRQNMRGCVFTRRRTLEEMGWQVLPIELEEWEKHARGAREMFLRNRLAEHVPEIQRRPKRRNSLEMVH